MIVEGGVKASLDNQSNQLVQWALYVNCILLSLSQQTPPYLFSFFQKQIKTINSKPLLT